MSRISLTERIARRIATTHSPFAKWPNRSPEAHTLFRKMARAAMYEMRAEKRAARRKGAR